MIGMLGGSKETIAVLKASVGRKIMKAEVTDNQLRLHFKDGAVLRIWDDGQSYCESRYMDTDDNLKYFTNTKLMDLSIETAPKQIADWSEHEIQFLHVKTGKGSFTVSNHNEHNGYYGGFWLQASLDDPRGGTGRP